MMQVLGHGVESGGKLPELALLCSASAATRCWKVPRAMRRLASSSRWSRKCRRAPGRHDHDRQQESEDRVWPIRMLLIWRIVAIVSGSSAAGGCSR